MNKLRVGALLVMCFCYCGCAAPGTDSAIIDTTTAIAQEYGVVVAAFDAVLDELSTINPSAAQRLGELRLRLARSQQNVAALVRDVIGLVGERSIDEATLQALVDLLPDE